MNYIHNPNNEILKSFHSNPRCLRCGLEPTTMVQLCDHCFDYYKNTGSSIEEIIYFTNGEKQLPPIT